MKYRICGREKRLAFGPYPKITLATARRQRDGAKAILANGEDSGQIKQEKKRSRRAQFKNTFAALADEFMLKSAKEGRSGQTGHVQMQLLQQCAFGSAAFIIEAAVQICQQLGITN
jgi:hypothetical protein